MLPQAYISPINVGPESTELTCPYCKCKVSTTVRHKPTAMTYFLCLLLCGVGCCCIPFCVDSCRNTNHFCPSCDAFLGTYKSV